MIVLRKADGSAIPLDTKDALFVELVNDLDQTVMKAIAQVKPGMLLVIEPGSDDAAHYEQMFGGAVKFSTQKIELVKNP